MRRRHGCSSRAGGGVRAQSGPDLGLAGRGSSAAKLVRHLMRKLVEGKGEVVGACPEMNVTGAAGCCILRGRSPLASVVAVSPGEVVVVGRRRMAPWWRALHPPVQCGDGEQGWAARRAGLGDA